MGQIHAVVGCKGHLGVGPSGQNSGVVERELRQRSDGLVHHGHIPVGCFDPTVAVVFPLLADGLLAVAKDLVFGGGFS